MTPGAPNTIIFRLNDTLERITSRKLNLIEKYLDRNHLFGDSHICLDFGSAYELQSHLPKINEWLPNHIQIKISSFQTSVAR